MSFENEEELPRREREILNILFNLGSGTSSEVREQMEKAPSGNAVRAHLQILENKEKIVRDHKRGREFVYKTVENPGQAGKRALGGVLKTFFDGSISTALAAHLSNSETVDSDEYERLRQLIDNHQQEGTES